MRHRIKGRKLNRTASHRKALIRNLANQLFEYKEIRTTTAKAKEARVTIERLITYAKKGDTHHRRLAFSFLRQKETIKTLFDEIAPAYTERQGGYTRVIKLGRRQGDGAHMAILQLVGFETLADTSKPEKKKKQKKKEEKSVENDIKSVDTKKVESEDVQADENEKLVEGPDKVKEETPAEESKQVVEEKPAEEPKEVEEEKPAPEEVKEESEEVKTEEPEPDEEKKE
ncbi:MAG: 50S ribosomal protein L17 [Calditrichia bacterium]